MTMVKMTVDELALLCTVLPCHFLLLLAMKSALCGGL